MKIECRNCSKECYSGKRGLCNVCYSKDLKVKAKVKKAKAKAQKKIIDKRFNKSNLMKTADTIFSLYIRLRDSDTEGNSLCCSSGKMCEWSSLDNGHYIPRGYMKYRYDERNCNAQSKNDNSRLHGNIPEYRRFIISKYGQEVEQEMFMGSKELFKVDSSFFLNIIAKYVPVVLEQLSKKTFNVENYIINVERIKRLYLDQSIT